MKLSERILIVKLSAFGDIVQTLPIAAGLKHLNPKVFIGWVISKSYRELVEKSPYVDRVFIFERQRWAGVANFCHNRREFWQLILDIRQARFGTVLDFQGLFRSAFLTWMSGAPRRIGFANAREFAPLAYTDKVKTKESIHAVDRYITLASRALPSCLSGAPQYATKFVLQGTEDYRSQINIWRSDGPMVIFVPGARWENKRWPAHHFATLADILANHQIQIVLIGASSDISIGQEILKSANSHDKIVNLIGKTSTRQLITLMEQAHLVVSNDSGPMHLAAALNIPTIAIFGPTDPIKTGPYGTKHIVVKVPLPCTPCLKKHCDHSPYCMEEVSPKAVLAAITEMCPRIFTHSFTLVVM